MPNLNLTLQAGKKFILKHEFEVMLAMKIWNPFIPDLMLSAVLMQPH